MKYSNSKTYRMPRKLIASIVLAAFVFTCPSPFPLPSGERVRERGKLAPPRRDIKKGFTVKALEKILDAQAEGRLPQDVFERKVLPVLFRLCGEDKRILADLYRRTGFAGRYNFLAEIDDKKKVPPFLLGKLAVMIGNEYEHVHQNQWDEIAQDNKVELEAFSPRLREALKKKWLKGLGYTASEFSAFIKLIYEVLQKADPADQEMLERHMCAFLDVGEIGETYFSAFIKLAGSSFGTDLAGPFGDYASLRSFDKAVRWVRAYEGLVELRALLGESNRPFLDDLEEHICKLESNERKLGKLERLQDEVKMLIWIIHGKLGMELKEDLLKKIQPPLKGKLPDEVRGLIDRYAFFFKRGSQGETIGFLSCELEGVLITPAAVRVSHPWWQGLIPIRRQPQEIAAQPSQPQQEPSQIDRKDARLALRELISMKALDVCLIQKELGIEHADLSHPRIQTALEPLIKQLKGIAGEVGLRNMRYLAPVLAAICNGEIKDGDAREETLKQAELNFSQLTKGLDQLLLITSIDEGTRGVDDFKSVYIRGLILNQFIAARALQGLGMIERIFSQEALRTEDGAIDSESNFFQAIYLIRFFNFFYTYMHAIRKLALNYINLGRLDLARKAYSDFFKVQKLYKRYLAVIHDERLRRRVLQGAERSIEEPLQYWQPRREEFNHAFERHTRYKDDANVVTAGLEMEFNVVNRQGAVIKKIGQMSIEVSDEEMKDLEWEDIKDAMREKLDGRFGLTIDEDSPELTSGLVIRDLDEIFGDFLRTSPQAIEQDPVGVSPATLGRSVTGLINELYLYGIERLPKALENTFRKYPQVAYFTELASPQEASGLFVVPDNIHINLGEGYRHAKNYLGISLFEQVFTNSEKRDNEFAAVRSIQFTEPSNGRSDNYRGKIELLTLTPRSRPFDLNEYRAYLNEGDFACLRANIPSQARFITTPPEVASRLKGQFEAALNGTERRLERGEGLSLNGQTVILSFLMTLISWYSKSPVGEADGGSGMVDSGKRFPWINASQQDAIRLYKALKEGGLDGPILEGLSFRQMMDNILRDPDFIKEYLLFFGSVPEYLALLAFAKPNAPISDISMPDAESKEALAEYPGQTPETILAKWREVYTQGNIPSAPAPFATSVEKGNPYLGKEPQHRLAFITSRDELSTWGIDYLELSIHPFKPGIRVPLSSPYVKWAYDRAWEFLTNPKTEPLETSSYPMMRDYFPIVRDMLAANAKDDTELAWVRTMLDSAFNQLTREPEQEVFTAHLIRSACAFAQQGKPTNLRAVVAAEITKLAIDKAGFEWASSSGETASSLVANMAMNVLSQSEREGHFNRAADRFNAITRLEASSAERGEAFERPLSTLLLTLMSLYLPDVDIDAERLFKWVDASNPYRMSQFIAPLFRLAGHLVKLNEKSEDYKRGLQRMSGLLRRLHYELSSSESKDLPDFNETTNLLNVVAHGLICGRPPLTSSALFVCLPSADEALDPEKSSYSIAHWAWQARRELEMPVVFKPHKVVGLRLVDEINRNIPNQLQKGGIVSLAEIKDEKTVVIHLSNPGPIGELQIAFISYKEGVSALIHFKEGSALPFRFSLMTAKQRKAAQDIKERLKDIIAHLMELGVGKVSLSGVKDLAGHLGGELTLLGELFFQESGDPSIPWIRDFSTELRRMP